MASLCTDDDTPVCRPLLRRWMLQMRAVCGCDRSQGEVMFRDAPVSGCSRGSYHVIQALVLDWRASPARGSVGTTSAVKGLRLRDDRPSRDYSCLLRGTILQCIYSVHNIHSCPHAKLVWSCRTAEIPGLREVWRADSSAARPSKHGIDSIYVTK